MVREELTDTYSKMDDAQIPVQEEPDVHDIFRACSEKS
jgi:hypothetical protein